MRRNKIFLLFASVFLCVALPGSVHAATYVVTTSTDESPTSSHCTDEDVETDCSLREAVIASNSNSGSDTISIPAGTYTFATFGSDTGEDAAAKGDLDITDTSGTLTMTGAGSGSTIINANDIDRVFHTVLNTTSVFEDLTMTNGTTSSSGAGIQALGTTTLDSVVISNNVMSGFAGYGGGIRCDTNTLTIIDSTISGNSVGLGHYGGGINANICDLTISGSTFRA